MKKRNKTHWITSVRTFCLYRIDSYTIHSVAAVDMPSLTNTNYYMEKCVCKLKNKNQKLSHYKFNATDLNWTTKRKNYTNEFQEKRKEENCKWKSSKSVENDKTKIFVFSFYFSYSYEYELNKLCCGIIYRLFYMNTELNKKKFVRLE